jgi:hypothetical protein
MRGLTLVCVGCGLVTMAIPMQHFGSVQNSIQLALLAGGFMSVGVGIMYPFHKKVLGAVIGFCFLAVFFFLVSAEYFADYF